jgi:DNA-binding response OmpR family regulator
MEILLVDQDTGFSQALKQALYMRGYDVTMTDDGVDACQKLLAGDFDLIISEAKVTRLDGLELHAFVRSSERYKRRKFLFVSQSNPLATPRAEVDPNNDQFVSKSLSVREIVRAVDCFLFGVYAERWLNV